MVSMAGLGRKGTDEASVQSIKFKGARKGEGGRSIVRGSTTRGGSSSPSSENEISAVVVSAWRTTTCSWVFSLNTSTTAIGAEADLNTGVEAGGGQGGMEALLNRVLGLEEENKARTKNLFLGASSVIIGKEQQRGNPWGQRFVHWVVR